MCPILYAKILSERVSVDITANLKGAVAKAQVPKMLQTLVERGELTQKVVGKGPISVIRDCCHLCTGKSCFFVINQVSHTGNSIEIESHQLLQANLPEVPQDQLVELEKGSKVAEEEVKVMQGEVKQLQLGG
jgi:hypothetical protein